MKRKIQLAELPDNWNSEREMGSRQGNTVEPFLRFSVPREEEKRLEKRTKKKKERKKERKKEERKKREESGAPTKKAFDNIAGSLHRKLLNSG